MIVVLFLSGCQGQAGTAQCFVENFTLESSKLSVTDYVRLENPPFGNHDREQLVAKYFSAVCPQIQLQRIDNHAGHNIICRIAGREKKRIVVGAHFDRIGGGYGVADNWSGIILISRLITELNTRDLHLTWEIVAFGAEEYGLKGSKSYVKKAVRDREISDILAMINVDTLGLGTVKLDSRSHKGLKCLTMKLADELGITLSTISLPAITGDWEPFRHKNIPVLGIHSLDRRLLRKVHSRRDSRRAISNVHLEDAWRLLLNLQRYLDQTSNIVSNLETQASRSVPTSSENKIPI